MAEAGAVGGSIEDWDADAGIYERDHAAERIAAAAEAARALDFPFTLTARAENFFRRNPDLDDTVGRLQAYEEAGADVLYAPGLASGEQIKAVADAVSKPLNVLAFPPLTMDEIAAAGGQRVSIGSQLAWAGIGAAAQGRGGDAGHRRVLGVRGAGAGEGLAQLITLPGSGRLSVAAL